MLSVKHGDYVRVVSYPKCPELEGWTGMVVTEYEKGIVGLGVDQIKYPGDTGEHSRIDFDSKLLGGQNGGDDVPNWDPIATKYQDSQDVCLISGAVVLKTEGFDATSDIVLELCKEPLPVFDFVVRPQISVAFNPENLALSVRVVNAGDLVGDSVDNISPKEAVQMQVLKVDATVGAEIVIMKGAFSNEDMESWYTGKLEVEGFTHKIEVAVFSTERCGARDDLRSEIKCLNRARLLPSKVPAWVKQTLESYLR